MKNPFNFEDLDKSITANTERMENEERNRKSARGPVVPDFIAQALQESNIEKNQIIKSMQSVQRSVLATRHHQDMHLGLNTENIYSGGQSGAMTGLPSAGAGGAGQGTGQDGKNVGKTTAQIEAEKKRQATAPTRLLHRKVMKELAAKVKTQVFGQDEVVDEIVSILKVACLEIRLNKDKPAGCYFLAGPSGCGKTEMVLALTKFLSEEDRPIPFLKLNMGEFGMENDVTKLIGPPPGYRGNENGGQLTNFVLENPISIILFDEMEKAHESMDKIFLSILDKGVCSDGLGREVRFNNTIIMVTSNLGADIEYYPNYTKEEKHQFRMEAIHESLRPEIVNRFDIIAQCNALPLDVYEKVMAKFLKDLYKNMLEVHNVTLTHSEQLLKWAAEVSYDPAMGGRPARKFIEKVVIKPLADSMIYEEVDFEKDNDLIIDLTEDKNVCFKDRHTGKILGELKETADIVKHLQSAKFVKQQPKSTNTTDPQQILQQLMASGEDSGVIDALGEVTNTEDNTNTTPVKRKGLASPKANRKSSRNDFAAG